MIVLNVTYTCRTGKRGAFLEAIESEGIDAASRAEEGNIKYDYYFSEKNPDELLLLEKWKDADALAKHAKEAHFLKLGSLKDDYVADTHIERFEVQ